MTQSLILVADDEPMVRDVLGRYLERDGFRVRGVEDGESALAALEEDPADLVLLDLMLPRLDGFEVFRRIRAGRPTPVIMLTARGDETDRIVGLELGADDYIAKPFSPREVVARVRAVLRRANPAPESGGLVRFDGVLIDPARREVVRDDEPVHVTRKEFDLLWHLASRPGVVHTRSELLEHVWDFAWDGDTSTVTVHIRRLREKIERDPSRPAHLVTVWGVGYRFEP